MLVAELLSRLKLVRRARRGWIAQCPAHPDRAPSLSIGEGCNGKILLHCFAGCTVETICGSLKISVSDLFPESKSLQSKPREVREAEKHIENFRGRLSPRERVLPVTVIYCKPGDEEAGIARALALMVEGEMVQAVLEGQR